MVDDDVYRDTRCRQGGAVKQSRTSPSSSVGMLGNLGGDQTPQVDTARSSHVPDGVYFPSLCHIHMHCVCNSSLP